MSNKKTVAIAMSGGVDSSVAAALISRAVGNQLTCIFVDHGLLRKDEGDMVEAVMKEKSTNDMQHNLEVLSSELKSSNFLTPRRTVQSASNTVNIRLLKTEEKAYQFFHLKEVNMLRKVSEDVITYQTIKVSTLLSRMGYHVFALRKIII